MGADHVLNQVNILYIGATMPIEKIHNVDKLFDNILFSTIYPIKTAF